MMQKAIQWLLERQFIKSQLLEGRLWEVKLGSGMGLRASKAICDAALVNVLEDPFILKPGPRRALQYKHYYRFCDDIFLFIASSDLLDSLMHIFKHRIRPFTAQIIETSETSVKMLALRICKHGTQLRFDTKVKKLQAPPLAADSAHHSGVSH